MKFRIKEKPWFDPWTGEWESVYVIQHQFLYFFWWSTSEHFSLYVAEHRLEEAVSKYLKNQGFKKSRKVVKEIKV